MSLSSQSQRQMLKSKTNQQNEQSYWRYLSLTNFNPRKHPFWLLTWLYIFDFCIGATG